jgi:hypothetical protein
MQLQRLHRDIGLNRDSPRLFRVPAKPSSLITSSYPIPPQSSNSADNIHKPICASEYRHQVYILFPGAHLQQSISRVANARQSIIRWGRSTTSPIYQYYANTATPYINIRVDTLFHTFDEDYAGGYDQWLGLRLLWTLWRWPKSLDSSLV